MTDQEYKIKLAEFEAQHQKDIKDLKIKYALSNSPFSKGDVVADSFQKIKVDKILVTGAYGRLPECVYEGVLLKKDGTPMLSGKRGSVYQCNILS